MADEMTPESMTQNDAAPQRNDRPVGPPQGNLNGLRNGSRMAVARGGKLPRGCERLERQRNRRMRALEQAVLDTHGAIGPAEQLNIEMIGDAIARKLICQRRHREIDPTDIETEQKLLESIEKANRTIVQGVKALKLQTTSGDMSELMRRLYGDRQRP